MAPHPIGRELGDLVLLDLLGQQDDRASDIVRKDELHLPIFGPHAPEQIVRSPLDLLDDAK